MPANERGPHRRRRAHTDSGSTGRAAESSLNAPHPVPTQTCTRARNNTRARARSSRVGPEDIGPWSLAGETLTLVTTNADSIQIPYGCAMAVALVFSFPADGNRRLYSGRRPVPHRETAEALGPFTVAQLCESTVLPDGANVVFRDTGEPEG